MFRYFLHRMNVSVLVACETVFAMLAIVVAVMRVLGSGFFCGDFAMLTVVLSPYAVGVALP